MQVNAPDLYVWRKLFAFSLCFLAKEYAGKLTINRTYWSGQLK